ncbi:MAG: FlgD immunoglobulin-like domain containing protein [Candidatus Cloacimonadota bacterium]|nr:FlgD immunoglobulin-like domain containing protein [Candidatus Cloacimonadota bacterium]
MLNNITNLDFQLAYLAMLTEEKLKPLSRWEKEITSSQLKILKQLGLKVNIVPRKLLNGKKIYETVFSSSTRYLDLYLKNFNDQPITFHPHERELEGFLFGYPKCCVKNFIEFGYKKNTIKKKDQEILFHWTCPDCRITPSLIPLYREIHNECKKIFSENEQKVSFDFNKVVKRSLPYAAAFLLFLSPSLIADEHWIPVPGDADNNFLTGKEEILLGAFPFAESHSIANYYRDIINNLPRQTSQDSCYAVDNFAYGLYTCPICGETANMGFVTAHNPLHELEINIPYMALHFMEHGSFTYARVEQPDTFRIDIELLKETLAPLDVEHHEIATPNDSDDDGLNNPSEIFFETDPNNPYTHNIGIDDGHEISEAIINHISDLPIVESGANPPSDSVYIDFLLANGVENCSICGKVLNMGSACIHNPMEQTYISFPFMGLHYISHGRFAFEGTTNQGEVDPIELCEVLDIDLNSIDNLGKILEKYDYQLINFSNPFAEHTTISFEIPDGSTNSAKIIIYNLKGQKISEIDCGNMTSGINEVFWDGKNQDGKPTKNGIYFYKLMIDGKAKTIRKCVKIG